MSGARPPTGTVTVIASTSVWSTWRSDRMPSRASAARWVAKQQGYFLTEKPPSSSSHGRPRAKPSPDKREGGEGVRGRGSSCPSPEKEEGGERGRGGGSLLEKRAK